MNRPTESSSYTWLMSGILPIKTLQGFLPIFLPGKRKFISSLKQACDLRPQQRNTTSIIIHVTYRNNYFNSILLKNSCISYIMMCQGKLHLPTHTPKKEYILIINLDQCKAHFLINMISNSASTHVGNYIIVCLHSNRI